MIVLMFIIGAIFGSFYLVLGTRLPLKENIFTGRSRCDHCKTELKWYELIPIFSFLFLKGKCRTCKKKISTEHLVVEIITGLLFLIGFIYYGYSYDYLLYLILISVTVTVFVSDFKYMIILDSTWIIGTILILIITYLKVGLEGLYLSALSGIGLFLVMLLIKLIGDVLFKKESLGGGDIKLSLLIGSVIGFRLGLISLIFASFLALPYALMQLYLTKKNELPYGPFLISSAVIIFMFIEKFQNLLIFFTLS